VSAFVLGVDIGTTSTKAVLFDTSGGILAQSNVEYPLLSPVPFAAEQDPDQILRAVMKAVRTSLEKSVEAAGGPAAGEGLLCVAFSAAMHSLIAMDKVGNPLTQCITWADNRSAAWARRLKEELGGHDIYMRTGTPIHPMSPLPKLLWLRDTKPDVFAAAARFISIKEYVLYRLFGRYVVDWSIASASGLFNMAALDWDSGALAVAGIDRSRLSELVPPTFALRGLNAGAAAEMRLSPDTPFIVGANDGALSNLGLAAIAPGVVAVSLGTSGAVRTVTSQPRPDPQERTFCYALTASHWVVGGPVNNGGMVFRWIRDELATAESETARRLGLDPYDVLTKIAERVPAGSEGLIFHPYLAGERAPLWNANARGSFFGLAMHHRKEHMIRAALEGVMFNLYSVLLSVERVTGPAARIEATGGFARSPLWRQMMADVFNREVHIPESHESSCLGAAVLGLYAMERISSIEAVSGMVGSLHRHRPEPEQVRRYAALLPIFLDLPAQLHEQYERIAAAQGELLR